MKNRKMVYLGLILIALIGILGLTYAVFTYQQTGTNNQQLVLGDIYMHYQEVNAINMEGALPGDEYSEYFEFTISGKNTYTKQDIYYDVIISKGEVPEGKTEENRIPDEYLKFKLTKVNEDLTEEVLLEDVTYEDLTNQRIYVETINKNTTIEINNTYRLYMVISDELTIGNTSDAMYDSEEFKNMFASIKVNVTGDFNEKEIPTPTFVEVVKGRYGIDETLVAVNTNGDLYDGTGSIREYRYSGPVANNYVFFDTDGDGEKDTNEIWRIIGVFKDTIKDEDGNVVNDASGNPTYEEKVKLMRNTMLTADELPESYVIGDTTYTIASSTTSSNANWNKNDSGSQINDWTTAGLQYYLNTENDESETPNAGYLSLLTSEAKELISLTTYHLGNFKYDTDTAKSGYVSERDENNIHENNHATWDGLVGLMYPSDYGYSANAAYWEVKLYLGGYDTAQEDGIIPKDTSWMQTGANHTTYEWLLSPSSGGSNYALYWNFTGFVEYSYVYYNRYLGVRPVLNLKSGTKVIDGLGTEEDPFEIVIE